MTSPYLESQLLEREGYYCAVEDGKVIDNRLAAGELERLYPDAMIVLVLQKPNVKTFPQRDNPRFMRRFKRGQKRP